MKDVKRNRQTEFFYMGSGTMLEPPSIRLLLPIEISSQVQTQDDERGYTVCNAPNLKAEDDPECSRNHAGNETFPLFIAEQEYTDQYRKCDGPINTVVLKSIMLQLR